MLQFATLDYYATVCMNMQMLSKCCQILVKILWKFIKTLTLASLMILIWNYAHRLSKIHPISKNTYDYIENVRAKKILVLTLQKLSGQNR